MDPRDRQAIDAAKLYYLYGLPQAEVARELGVSRPTVSKLIQHAKGRGFVHITISDPHEDAHALASRLRERFQLADVHLVIPPRPHPKDLLRELGTAGAALLESLVADDMSIGISWGRTMYAVSTQLRPTTRQGVSVVQLKGGHSLVPSTERDTMDAETLSNVATAFNATTHALPLPVIFDNVATKQAVEQDRHIARVLERGREVDLVVFTVGDVHRDALLMNLGYLSEREIGDLLQHAVGDACSRFFTSSGAPAAPEIDARTVGISLEALRSRPLRVLVAGGVAKANAIETALRIGLATHVVIDAPTAEKVLDLAADQPGNGALSPDGSA